MSTHLLIAKSADRLFLVSVTLIALLSILILGSICFFLVHNSLPFFQAVSLTDMLTVFDWNPESLKGPAWGMLSLFGSTILVTICSLLISLPISFLTAVQLAYRTSKQKRQILKPFIEMIASVPSVTIGLLGMIYLSPFVAEIFSLSNGLSALTASILVAIASLPTIISISDDALRAVDSSYTQASLSLGANDWQTIAKVMVPASRSGLLAAVMLGLGRIIGETMIVLMVAGNSHAYPTSIFSPIRPLTATIAIEVKEVVTGSLHWSGLFALATILLVVTFVLNSLAEFFIHSKE